MREDTGNRLLSVLAGSTLSPPPVWLMRQAGRYLPEYRAIRQQAGSFWAMCTNPELAAEVTLQPVRRFGLDAAILFSDILVVPYAMGRRVEFEDGPKLDAITNASSLVTNRAEWAVKLSPVYETVKRVKQEIGPETALLGFAGGPWTLATYLAEGKGSIDQRAAKLWGYRDPVGFGELLDKLGECIAFHLIRQIEAGADAVQIFDSWAAGLAPKPFAQWVIGPTRRIVDRVRAACPNAKIIGFPRAATFSGYAEYVMATGVDAVSLDTAVSMQWAAGTFPPNVAIQGNLDPIVLLAGGQAMADAIDSILRDTAGHPFIFNLGHGVLPETPIRHVETLIARVRRE